MAQYVRISSEDMDSFMEALGFRELSRESRGLTVKEKVFERPFHEGRIRVYSSVEDRPGRLAAGRKMGRDAIRVQYWIDDTKVFGAKRVHRVVNWRRNMLDRVYEIEDMFGHRPVPRDSSGNLMVVRTSKQGKKFWGSRDFPRTKDTRRFAAQTEVKESVVIAPRKPTGIVDAVMMNHAMMEEAKLQDMIIYLENMVQLGLLDENEVMKELHKTFGSEYYLDDNLEDVVMDEYLEDEDYDDAEIYARNAMKKLNAEEDEKHCEICNVGSPEVFQCEPPEGCLDYFCTDHYNFSDDGCFKCNPVTPDGQNQEEFFQDKFYESERMAQEASDYPLNHLGFWFEMANESYGGDIRDMLEKPWNWRQEMTRYLFEGGFEGVIYGDDEDLFALGFDASYPPYLTLKEMGELYDWMPTHEDYKGYVHNYYRAEYEEVTNSPLGIIVKDQDGKTYVLVPEDLAQIIFERSKYVLDAEWRKEELLYSDEINDMMPISVGTMMFEKIYVATRNEGDGIVTYIVQEELIDEEKLYRILVVIDGPLGNTHKKYLEAVMDEM